LKGGAKGEEAVTALAFVPFSRRSLTAPLEQPTQLQLAEGFRVENRCWLRGQVAAPSVGSLPYWRWHSGTRQSPPPFHAEIRTEDECIHYSGHVRSDGAFDILAAHPAEPAPRGWRIAQVRIAVGDADYRSQTVILDVPVRARPVRLVILPLQLTGCVGDYARASKHAVEVARSLAGDPAADSLWCFLAVGLDPALTESNLALLAEVSGWPKGLFVICRTHSHQQSLDQIDTVCRSLEWLFADHDTQIVNLEPYWHGSRRMLAGSLQGPRLAEWARHGGMLTPRYPVVFCHGMLAFSFLRFQVPVEPNCFVPLRSLLRQRRLHALFPHVSPTGGVAVRAQALREQIQRWTREPVNLIAHSMGGLDARYLISHLAMANRVRSLTTISTPHRGTYLADWFLQTFDWRLPLMATLQVLGYDLDGFRDCRPTVCQRFNELTPDDPRVQYFSYGAEVASHRVSPALRRGWSLLSHWEGANDGMVSRQSASWGTYLGTLQADHFAQTPDLAFVRPREDFDCPRFYCQVLDNLARRGL
jgi:triacylglycerol lipase